MKQMIACALAMMLALPVLAEKTADERAQDAMKKGAEFLITMQNADGSFGKKPQPAVAALCAVALNGVPIDAEKRQKAIDSAMDYVLSFVKEDGSFRGEPGRHFVFFSDAGYPTYTTAVALLAMWTYKDGKPDDYFAKMKAAREFLKTAQIEDENSPNYGGFSYGKGGKADMSNTAWAAEALHVTEKLDQEPYTSKDEETKKSSKELWSALDEFLKKSQNLAKEGEKDSEKDGGFAYRPGTVVSSGSMSYAGLKSMIYAKLKPNDPRVKGLMNYVEKNYTVDANPGQGNRGYFYYIQTMAKALNVAKLDAIKTEDGDKNWRDDIINKLCDLQTETGAWVNTNGRYMESDLNLVTAYAMISLQQAMNAPATKADE